MKSAILKFAKSVRLQRGGAWRAVRVGAVVMVVVVWAWVYLVAPPTSGTSFSIRGDSSSRLPNLQVAPPISDGRDPPPPVPPQPPGGGGGGEKVGINAIVNKPIRENGVDFIEFNDKLKQTGDGGQDQENKRKEEEETNPRHRRGREDKPGGGNNEDDKVFPKIFPQRRIVLPGDNGLLVEEEEDEEEEEEAEEGKWNGRNMEETDNNHAMEEVDEAVGIGEDDDNDNNNNNDDDFVEEDVGGEAIKNKKRQRREKPRNKAGNNKTQTNKNKKNNRRRTANDLESDNYKRHRDLEEYTKLGQRSQKIQNDPHEIERDIKRGQGSQKAKNDPHDLERDIKRGQGSQKAKNDPHDLERDIKRGQRSHKPQHDLSDLKIDGKRGQGSQKTKNDLSDLERNEKQGQKAHNDPLHVDLLAVEEDMRGRRSRVKQVCARYGLGPHAPPGARKKIKYPPTPSYETFYINRGDRLAWCPVYKAASTSWLYGFLGLAGISESYVKNTKEQVSTVARRVWPSMPFEEAKEAMGMCVKALVVRHPFERLASAFRDKLELVAGGEAHGTEHFYQKFGRKIVEKYRKREDPGGHSDTQGRKNQGIVGLKKENHPPLRYSNALNDDPVPPQPPQRYRHVLDESITQRKEPTFVEFVRYLIDTDLTLYADDHWMPYHISCTPCLLDFDVIAKFETLDRDQTYLLHKTSLQGKLKLSWRHLTKGNRTADVIKRYFSEVSKKDLLSLYGMYRLDFEMFDYTVDDYLEYVVP